MKNQLKPNTYTICESTEQCKELVKFAKSNGFHNDLFGYDYGDMEIAYGTKTTLSVRDGMSKQNGRVFMPLPEFIARLKGEWVEGKTVTLSDGTWSMLLSALDANEVNDYSDVINEIKEQLNKQ